MSYTIKTNGHWYELEVNGTPIIDYFWGYPCSPHKYKYLWTTKRAGKKFSKIDDRQKERKAIDKLPLVKILDSGDGK